MTMPSEKHKDKSAIDIIYEMYDILQVLTQKVNTMEGRLISLQTQSFERKIEAQVVSAPPSVSAVDASEVVSISSSKNIVKAAKIVDPLASIVPEIIPNFTVPKVQTNKPTASDIENLFTPENLSADEPSKNKPVADRIKVYGIFRDQVGRLVESVNITISDQDGMTVKTTKTNKVGEWMTYIAPDYEDKYSVEFMKPGIRPQFKPIKFIPGQREVEINIVPDIKKE